MLRIETVLGVKTTATLLHDAQSKPLGRWLLDEPSDGYICTEKF
jgi:hypothetical protein